MGHENGQGWCGGQCYLQVVVGGSGHESMHGQGQVRECLPQGVSLACLNSSEGAIAAGPGCSGPRGR